MKYLFTVVTLILIFSGALIAQETVKYVTYGSRAAVVEGDNDHRQNIFIKIPAEFKDTSLTLRGFDLDTGGDNDLSYGSWDSEMVYSLFSGQGTFSSFNPEKEKNPNGIYSEIAAYTKTIAADDSYNNKWMNLFTFPVAEGEFSDGFYYFRLEVNGSSGDDANVYDFSIGFADSPSRAIKEIKFFTYFITTRLENYFEYASIRFNAPIESSGIISNDFDAGGADLKINTPFRSISIPKINNQGAWSTNRINLLPQEAGAECEIYFGKGGETPNDATFFITDLEGNYLQLQLPVQVGKVNSRPEIKHKIVPLADCYSVVFDAEQSIDPDGDRLKFTWDFGDGTTEVGARKVHKYEDQREYNVTLIVEDNSGAIANASLKNFTVKVNVPPQASAGENIVTFPGKSVSFSADGSSDSDGIIKVYQWEMGDGSNLTGKNINYAYKAPGVFTVRLTVIDDSDSPCNTGVDEIEVRVNAAPVAVSSQPKMSATGETINFSATKSYDPDGEIVRYSWDFGDGNTSEGAEVNHQYSNPGTFEVKLVISDNSNVLNSVDSTFVPIIINAPPEAEAGEDKLVAVDELFVINGEGSSDKDGRIIRYDWDMGDGTMKTGYSVAHSYQAPGKYKVKLKVKDDSNTKGNEDDDFITVTVNARPTAVAGKDFYITYGRVEFDGSGSNDPDGSIIAYDWDFGDGSTGTGVNPAHIYRNPGEYNVRLRVTDNTPVQNNFHEDFIAVKINRVPLADAGPDEISAPGIEVNFDGSNSFDTDGKIVRYEWTYGDGNSSEGVKVAHVYSKPGIYSARLKVFDHSGHPTAYDMDTRVITVNAPPVPFAGADILTAPDMPVLFDAGVSYDIDGIISEYFWEFSDGENSDELSFTRTFETPGTYYGYLTVRDNADTYNSVKVDTVVIKVNNKPVAKAGNDIVTCENYISFDASLSTDVDGDPLSYTWDFGDGCEPVSGKVVVHNYKNGGNYPVTLTVNDNNKLSNSSDISSIVVKINKSPKADAGADLVVCAGEATVFNASNSIDPEGGVLLYKWDFGDGTTGEGLTPTKIYTKGGVYQVSLTVEDDSGLPCNLDSDNIVVEVVESPVANAGSDMTVCANTEVKFDGTASKDYDGVVNSYDWDFGDGGYGGGAKPTYIYKKAGTYVATLTITGDLTPGCDNTDTDEIIVTVIEAPIAKFTLPEKHPVNEPLEFDGSVSSGEGSNIVEYSWDFGDGNTQKGKKIEHTYTEAGNYIVTLEIFTDSGTECDNSLFRELITINASPNADAGNDVVASVNEVISFDGGNSSDPDGVVKKYTWYFGDGNSNEGVLVDYQYAAPGNYSVILEVEDNTALSNNMDKDTLVVFVNSQPIAVISSPDVVCAAENFNLDASKSRDGDNNVVNYKWIFPDGNSKQGEKIEHNFKYAGNYSVRLEVTDNSGASDSVGFTTKVIKVNRQPIPVMKFKKIVVPQEVFSLSANGSGDPDFDSLTYTWNFGDGNSLSGKDVSYQYNSAGTYTIVLTVDDGNGVNCSPASISGEIKVNTGPTAILDAPGSFNIGPANNKILLSAVNSSDPDGDALSYTWEFADGAVKEGEEIFYEISSPGEYKVRLLVDDGQGVENSVSIVEKVINVEMLK